jgi:hypothetical protein
MTDLFYDLEKADEFGVRLEDDETRVTDKRKFVENLGWLLSQTRAGVAKCRASMDGTFVTIYYDDQETGKAVNVECDSYIAIMRDVLKQI